MKSSIGLLVNRNCIKKTLTFLFVFFVVSASAQIDFTKPFVDCNVGGSITIYDYKARQWISSDINDSHYPTLPASTFKIINTLIIIEEGAIANENEFVKWRENPDTVKYGNRPGIYHDMNLAEAFKLSAGWVYLSLSKQIGKEKYRKYLTVCNYGNADLSVKDDDFWNFGNLTISPVNQIEILKGIYEETLPFSKKSFQKLKGMMVEKQTDTYVLRAKTGWTRDGGKDTGWWIGYVERTDNVYFFATRLIKDRGTVNPDFGSCRKEITTNILTRLHILE